MEGERRKRKLESGGHEEENEEQKMEKFFALIKSTKNVHDMLFNNDKEKTEKKAVEEDHKGKSIWTPAFQPEDFIDYGDQLRISTTTPHVAGPSEKEREVIEKEDFKEATPEAAAAPAPENHEEKEKASDQLDLNLSL